MKTVKQIADELGVSKETIRRRVKQLPPTVVTTSSNNTVLINAVGERILKQLVPTQVQKKVPTEAPQNDTRSAIPWEVYEDLRAQLAIKDKQIEELSAALVAAQQSAQAAQALHAGTMRKQLQDGKRFRWPWQKKDES